MISRIFLGLIAVLIGTIGILYLIDPNILLGRYDLVTGSAGMDNMLRATYGGLYLMCALIFLLGVFVAGRRRDALAFVALFMTGAAVGRIASVVAAGTPPATIMNLLYFEIVASVIAGVLFFRERAA